ncbi:response regulator, partial [Flavobacterium sp.]
MKLLLIEDEPELQVSIRQYFEMESNVVEVADDFSSAEEKIALYDYDCILIDI